MHEALGLILVPQMTTRKLSVVAHACHPSAWEPEARESPKVPSLTELQREALSQVKDVGVWRDGSVLLKALSALEEDLGLVPSTC